MQLQHVQFGGVLDHIIYVDTHLDSFHIYVHTSTMPRTDHMLLKIYVPTEDKDLRSQYETHVATHNQKVFSSSHPDAGFDLLCPVTQEFKVGRVKKYPLAIKCAATMHAGTESYPCGFFMYPRSSISKTSLRLANCTGIIDSGYRGQLLAMFDCFYGDYKVTSGDRLLQIVSPNMLPIKVCLVDSEEELGVSTCRGEGGFGSTGR